MEAFAIGDVVVAAFPFSDLRYFKNRPALVVGFSDFNDIILCQITSIPDGDLQKIKLTGRSFKSGGLPAVSYARPDKLFTLDRGLIKNIVGSLTIETIGEVKNLLREVLDI
jgi:mRNA interferase MazF